MYRFASKDTIHINADQDCSGVESILLSGETQRFEIIPLDRSRGLEFRIPDDIAAGIYGVYAKLHGDIVMHLLEIDVVERVKVATGQLKSKPDSTTETETSTHCQTPTEPRFNPKAYNRVLPCDSGWDD